MEDNVNYRPLKRSDNGISPMGNFIGELFNARTSFHVLHLSITGPGYFAAHKALNEVYDALPSLADDIAEAYQGATGKLLQIPLSCPRQLYSVEEAISYLDELYRKSGDVQSQCQHSDIINTIDEIKSLINSAKYKLKFLS